MSTLKTISRNAFVALLIVSNAAFAQDYNPLFPALGFNVFTSKDFTAGGGSVEGPVAMGGDIILKGSTIFAMNSSGTYPSGTLNHTSNYGMVINGKVVFTSGNSSQVNQGYLRLGSATDARSFYTDCNNAGTNLKITPYNADCNAAFNSFPNISLQRQQSNGSATTDHGIDFTTAFTQFQQSSATINSYHGSPNAQFNHITIPNTSNPHITLQDNKINLIELTPAQLNNLVSLGSVIFDNHPTATRLLVFNISSSDAIAWNTANFGGLSNDDGSYILWNFYGATGLTMQGSNPVFGSVLAPTADLTKVNNNNLYGQVIGKSLNMQPGQINYYTYKGSLPNLTQNLSVLPVKLQSFSGAVANDKASLQWNVTQNEAARYYELEKSTNGNQFSSASIALPTAKAGSETYRFNEPISVNTYYRLKIVGKYNSIVYSNTLMLQKEAKAAGNNLTLLQNPVTNNLAFRLSATEQGNALVNLYNTAGVLLFSKSVTANKGTNTISINLDGTMPTGNYLLQVSVAGKSSTARVIK